MEFIDSKEILPPYQVKQEISRYSGILPKTR